MSLQKKQKLKELQDKELRTICQRVHFYSEFWLETIEDGRNFNEAFVKSNGKGCGFCRFLEKKLDNDMLKSEQYTLKVLQISLCLLSLLLCPFISGNYGERGICLALSALSLFIIVGILLSKLLTLNRWLTQTHWFILETIIYGIFCLLFCLSSLSIALLNVHPQFIQENEAEHQQTLALIESFVLALSAATFAIDIGCVYSQRLSRTWIPFISKYRI